MSSSLKSSKYEYQHCIYTTNGSISIDISIFLGAPFKKALGAVGKWGPTSKKFWIFHVFGQRQKSNTHATRNFKMTQKGSALIQNA